MSIRPALIALAALVPIAAPALPPPVTQAWDGRPASRQQSAFQAILLARHNAARGEFGARPIAWNDRLAADARVYAERLARQGILQHDPQAGAAEPQGENLFAGTRGAFDFAEMAKGWIDERAHFRPGRFPEISRSGDWSDVGHYTQVVWPETREMGCAIASNAHDDYLVCRYWPAGNVIGTVLS
jgi:Cysteine-rich secretory protein family